MSIKTRLNYESFKLYWLKSIKFRRSFSPYFVRSFFHTFFYEHFVEVLLFYAANTHSFRTIFVESTQQNNGTGLSSNCIQKIYEKKNIFFLGIFMHTKMKWIQSLLIAHVLHRTSRQFNALFTSISYGKLFHFFFFSNSIK